MKIDMYLNIDAGTIRPQEHGEVFVTDDGIETDQDIGNYERFMNVSLTRANYCTTGQIYSEVIRRERAFEYNGEDVEAIPHVTDEIIRRITVAGENMKSDIVMVELGGTVGEYQNAIFFEAARILKLRNPESVLNIHVAYLPFVQSVGELKSKPVQTSVHLLNAMGIQPDFIVARSEANIDQKRRERLAMFCNVKDEDIIANPNVISIYDIPQIFHDQQFEDKILAKFSLERKKDTFAKWQKVVQKGKDSKKEVKIAMIGKYFTTGDYVLTDSYISVIEALRHGGFATGIMPNLTWVDSEKLLEDPSILSNFDGVVVPQGWGSRGTEGMIAAAKFARENNIPYLGLCFGMQQAVIEFARNVCGLKKANSLEVDPKTPHPVIYIMPDQKEYLEKKQYGGTIRLGSWPCKIIKGTKLFDVYKSERIDERHRHRYEVNNEYKKTLQDHGMVFSGVSPDGKLAEAMELKDHPFFVGTQYHPEYKTAFLNPHPLFVAYIKAVEKNAKTTVINK